MKKEIHANYKETKISCACGAKFEVESLKDEIGVEVCSNCHPFYTGKQGRTSSAGRIEKFNKKYGLDNKK